MDQLQSGLGTPHQLGVQSGEGALDASVQVANQAGNAAIAAAPLTWPTDFREDIPAITVPALILHGTADNIVPIDKTARRFRELLPEAILMWRSKLPALATVVGIAVGLVVIFG